MFFRTLTFISGFVLFSVVMVHVTKDTPQARTIETLEVRNPASEHANVKPNSEESESHSSHAEKPASHH